MKRFIALAALALTASLSFADTKQNDDAVNTLTTLNDQFNAAVVALDADKLVNFYSDDTLWIAQGKPASQLAQTPELVIPLYRKRQLVRVHCNSTQE